jgi:hypothetical protein
MRTVSFSMHLPVKSINCVLFYGKKTGSASMKCISVHTYAFLTVKTIQRISLSFKLNVLCGMHVLSTDWIKHTGN